MSDTKSTRTAIPKTEVPKSDVSTARPDSKFENEPKPESNVKDVIDSIWMSLISFIMMVVRFLHAAFEILADAIVKLYRIILFCYRKPQHAKELFVTTIHLMRVSYDAEIWTWTDMWEVLKSHLITPMTKSAPPRASDTKTKTK